MKPPFPSPRPAFAARWWIYQRERFPLAAHGPLVAAFSASAVLYAAQLTGRPPGGAGTFAAAFAVCLLFFLQLRIADEFKDRDEDARFRPYRPLPRGLVRLPELAALFALAAAAQAAVTARLWPPLLILLGVAWIYLALMSAEFFARDWLKARPVTYLWTHMLILPLVDFFATGCHWMPAGVPAPAAGLAAFLAASFCNGLVIELGRKLRQPADEEPGVPTYTALWGIARAPRAWWGCMAATAAFALLAAARIGAAIPVAAGLLPLLGVAAWTIRRFRAGAPGRRFETVSAVWTLALYLLLGPVAWLLR